MNELKIFDSSNMPSIIEKNKIVDFLHENLKQYGDAKSDILKAIDYSLKTVISFGGFTLLLTDNGKIVAATTVNKTGMGGYIPENILV